MDGNDDIGERRERREEKAVHLVDFKMEGILVWSARGGDVGDAYRTDGDADVDADENMRLTYQSNSREEKERRD